MGTWIGFVLAFNYKQCCTVAVLTALELAPDLVLLLLLLAYSPGLGKSFW